MKRNLVFLFLLIFTFTAKAQQKVLVPANVTVADMHLKLSKQAQEEIQKHVDYLLSHPGYFQAKVDRADTYFPIIERIFKEEGLPNDFKYLVLQESGLVSDAVSTSNAVGFWQFKKEAASDVGLAISGTIDERKHIVESSRGAAKYLIKHNNYYDNWIVTLLSYNLGFTGVKSQPEVKHAGKKVMPIEKDTHIYIQKFLAHKIAFENFVCRNPNPALKLEEYKVEGGGSLNDIARVTKVDIEELEKYNKWLGATTIPNNKTYTVILPLKNSDSAPVLASAGNNAANAATPALNPAFKANTFVSVNGLKAIVAGPGDTKDKLAMQAKISTRKLLRFNDMNSFDTFVEGQTYYVQNKRTSADTEYYIAQPGETLQMIAQKLGVREKSIRRKNRMGKDEVLVAGRRLWVQKTRPRYTPAEYERISEATTDKESKEGEEEALPEKIQAKVSFAALYHQETTSSPTTAEPEVLISKDNEFIDETELALLPEEEENAEPEQNQTAVNQQVALTKPTAKPEPVKAAPAIKETAKPAIQTEKTETDNVNMYALEEETLEEGTVENEETATEEAELAISEAETESEETEIPAENIKPAATLTASSGPAVPAKPAASVFNTKAPAAPEKAPAAAKPAPARPAAKPTEHIVAKGETFYSISRQYGYTPAELMKANNLKTSSLAIGQKLKLPNAEIAAEPEKPAVTAEKPAAKPAEATPAAASGAKSHTVQSGESMYKIARTHGLTVIDLLELNNRTDTNIKPGDVLIIKK